MDWNRLQYLPLGLPHFSVLVVIFFVLVAWIEVRALRLAYLRIGLGPHAAILLLLASLAGSYLNIPVARLSPEQVMSGQEVDFFGMRYVVPVVVRWPGTIVAVNVGGPVIPTLLSLYLYVRNELWIRGIIAIACVAAVCHFSLSPSPASASRSRSSCRRFPRQSSRCCCLDATRRRWPISAAAWAP